MRERQGLWDCGGLEASLQWNTVDCTGDPENLAKCQIKLNKKHTFQNINAIKFHQNVKKAKIIIEVFHNQGKLFEPPSTPTPLYTSLCWL